MSVAEYYQRMTGFANTMANSGQPLNDEEIIGYILAVLGPEHDDLLTSIIVLSNERKVTLPEFYSYLISHEAQSTAINTTVEFTTSASNATHQDTNPPRRNNRNGYKNTNTQQNNHRGGYGRGRGSGHGRNNGPQR